MQRTLFKEERSEKPEYDLLQFKKDLRRAKIGSKPMPLEAITADNLMRVFLKGEKKTNSILIVPWMLPQTVNQKQIAKYTSTHPRLEVPKVFLGMSDERKVYETLSTAKTFHLYFVIIAPRAFKEPLFWFGSYKDIPEENWNLTYTKDKNVKHRMQMKSAMKYNYVRFEVLKNELIKILTV